MSQHIFDYAIIGSGLGGLALATRISRETRNVVLLDGADHAGGINRPIPFPTGTLNNGLRFIADTPANRAALDFMEDLLGLKLLAGTDDTAPVTFEDGELREFLGFGENPPAFYDAFAPFLSRSSLRLHLEPYAWPALLAEKFQGTFMPRSYVTKIGVEEGKVTHVMINGAKIVKAHNVIFAGPAKGLPPLLPGETLNARIKQKIAKAPTWTGLCLDLCHAGAVTERTGLHILNGTTQDDIGPCAGRFQPSVETEKGVMQSSQWMTFLDGEATEDSEVVGHALKKIKRQIKRAYPTALDGLARERIVLAPFLGVTDAKLKADQTLPDIEGLWVASANFSLERGTLAAVQQARLVLAALGFGPSITENADLSADAEAQPI